MLYLPEKVYQLDDGNGLFLFFRDAQDQLSSVEVYLDDSETPPHLVTYNNDGEQEEVEKRLTNERAVELSAEDYRIDINERGDVGIIGRVQEDPFAP